MAAGLPSIHPLFYPTSNCLGYDDMSGSLQDHRLEDDEPLRGSLSVPHPSQISTQCLYEASPDLPDRRVIAPLWHDHEVTPPRLPCRIVTNSAVKVCARVGVDSVSIDLPET